MAKEKEITMAKEKEIKTVEPKIVDTGLGLLWVEYDKAQELIKAEKSVKEIKVIDGVKKYGFEKGK